MVNQSDIPSQLSAPVSRGGGFIPAPAPTSVTPGAFNASGYTVSVYDTLPADAKAHYIVNATQYETYPDPSVSVFPAARMEFDVPTGYVFILRKVVADLFLRAIFATNPFSGFLNWANGSANFFLNDYSFLYLTVQVNGVFVYPDLVLYQPADFHIELNLNLALAAGDNVIVWFHTSTGRVPPNDYTLTFDTSVQPAIQVFGHLIPDTGQSPSDTTLTNQPIPVTNV